MVRQIEQIRDEGDVPLRSVAILVRVAAENGEIVKALRDSHIPFEIVGLQGLLAQPEVQDVVSLLEVVDDVTANPADPATPHRARGGTSVRATSPCSVGAPRS